MESDFDQTQTSRNVNTPSQRAKSRLLHRICLCLSRWTVWELLEMEGLEREVLQWRVDGMGWVRANEGGAGVG